MLARYRGLQHPVTQLRDEMDRLLTGFLGRPIEGLWPSAGRAQPAVNLWEQSDALVAEMEVPGLAAEQIDISVVGGELTLRIERPEHPQEDITYHRRERPMGSASRVLRLPADVDETNVRAELKDGVLTITLPKAEAARPRKIQVSSAP